MWADSISTGKSKMFPLCSQDLCERPLVNFALNPERQRRMGAD
jgi:hypothetical protein